MTLQAQSHVDHAGAPSTSIAASSGIRTMIQGSLEHEHALGGYGTAVKLVKSQLSLAAIGYAASR